MNYYFQKVQQFTFKTKDIKLFFFFLLISLFIYSGKIIHIVPNPDALWNSIIYKSGASWEIGLGRYSIAFLQWIRGNVVNTTFITLLCLIWLSLICIFIISIFSIESPIWQALTGVLIILSPSIGCILTYYYCSDMYMLSYLLAVISIWTLIKKDTWHSLPASAILLTISCSIYQAYLGIAITICFLYLLYMLTDETTTLSQIFRQCSRFAIGGISAVFLYLCSNKLIQFFFHINAVEDRGFSKMGTLHIKELPQLLYKCYAHFYQYFFTSSMINNTGDNGSRRLINILFFILIVILLLALCLYLHLSVYRKLSSLILILLAPPAFMSIIIMAPEVNILDPTGVLMLPTMNYIYILGIILMLRIVSFFPKLIPCISYACCVSVSGMLLTMELMGQSYMQHNMYKTNFVASQIIAGIEEAVDESTQYKLCIIGNMENGNYPEQYPQLKESLHWLSPYYKTIWPTYSGTQNGWNSYFKQFCGKSYNICSWDEYQTIVQTGLPAQMSNFPDKNSIFVSDNIIIIKLSEPTW